MEVRRPRRRRFPQRMKSKSLRSSVGIPVISMAMSVATEKVPSPSAST